MEYKIGDLAHGGIVFSIDENGTKGCVAYPWDCFSHDGRETFNFFDAKELCNNTNWRLPTREELNLMHYNLHKQGLGGFIADNIGYWTSTPNAKDSNYGWYQIFSNGGYGNRSRREHDSRHVRPVREF